MTSPLDQHRQTTRGRTTWTSLIWTSSSPSPFLLSPELISLCPECTRSDMAMTTPASSPSYPHRIGLALLLKLEGSSGLEIYSYFLTWCSLLLMMKSLMNCTSADKLFLTEIITIQLIHYHNTCGFFIKKNNNNTCGFQSLTLYEQDGLN